MSKEQDLSYSEYPCVVHDIKGVSDSQGQAVDNEMNLSYFLPESSSINPSIKYFFWQLYILPDRKTIVSRWSDPF